MRKLTKEEYMIKLDSENRPLSARLAGKKVAWRVASCGDMSDLVLLQNCKGIREFEVPDIFLHTDDRPEFFDPSYWSDSRESHEMSLDGCGALARIWQVARKVTLTKVCEYERFMSIDGKLSYGVEIQNPNLGRIIEYKVTVMSKDRRRFTRSLIVAAVESAEFAVRFLVPNGTQVSSLCAFDYWTTFNGIKFAGAWVQRVAAYLGAKLFFSNCTSAVEQEDSWRRLCDIYPEMNRVPEVWCDHFGRISENLEDVCHLAGVDVYRLVMKENQTAGVIAKLESR